MDFSKKLNDKQLAAVSTNEQYVRVIAGAGSGKTRVLTHRIVYLHQEVGVPLYYIWALTFTNKAANEMKERVNKLLNQNNKKVNVSTIHSFCARFLREEIGVLNYRNDFTIYDEDDQARIVKDIAVIYGYTKRDPIIRETLNYISDKKNKGFAPGDIKIKYEKIKDERTILKMWEEYEKKLKSMNGVDFDDLLLFTSKILKENLIVRQKWQNRISHLLVDEFQDTNDIEFSIMRNLLSEHASLYVVGDPDQTIYTWRGANEAIILELDKKYNVKTYILDENYRSTQNVLDVANKLISHNKKRIHKDLFTNNARGEKVSPFVANDPDKEAEWVINRIIETRIQNEEATYSDFAILIRANYLTLPFERAFMRRQIPYKIYGGVRFYQRKEIKDALAYFRILQNDRDDISVERIANIPARGLSTKILVMKDDARLSNKPLLQVLKEAEKYCINKPNCAKIASFLDSIDKARIEIEKNERNISLILQEYLENVGYLEYVKSLKDEDKSEAMFENIKTLFIDIDRFIEQNPDVTFNDYLENAALLSAQDEVQSGDYITIMTVHMAKGLEYDYVFVANLNEGIFPNNRAVTEGGKKALEEERRLCYVAFTRARKQLFLSCNLAYNFVLSSQNIPSRFFKEADITVKFPSSKKMEFDLFRSYQKHKEPPIYFPDAPFEDQELIEWQVGDYARHSTFGHGVVVKVYPAEGIVDINFEHLGKKKLVANHKALKKIKKGDLV
ncbi:MAG TPA: UvrD-helicase domain-containing protein [Bacilli bacterium]|nr:UvrD-helicase domain-containing protein [Bacilli bacterium]HPK86179.1 UvrD-helicase domain-containing protein [Bacilli bacterium]